MHKNIFKIFLIILDAMDEALPLGYTYCCTELYSDTAEQGFITSKERTNAVIEKRINIMEWREVWMHQAPLKYTHRIML